MSPDAGRPAVAELRVGDDPAVWERLGFTLHDGVAHVGAVGIRPVGDGDGPGLRGWTLRDTRTTELDGLPTELTAEAVAPAGKHANGATLIDHVVVFTPDRSRTSAVLDAAGLGLRRVRTSTRAPASEERPVEQAFHRAGEVIVEVVGPPTPSGDGPATFWGLVCCVPDLDVLAELLGEDLGAPRDAVQAGHQIVTVRRTAGSSVPLAFINSQT